MQAKYISKIVFVTKTFRLTYQKSVLQQCTAELQYKWSHVCVSDGKIGDQQLNCLRFVISVSSELNGLRAGLGNVRPAKHLNVAREHFQADDTVHQEVL